MIEIAVACADQSALKARTWVSGVRLATDAEVTHFNYWETGAIIPDWDRRPATDDDIARIATSLDDPTAIRLWRITDPLGVMAAKMGGDSVSYGRPPADFSASASGFPGEINHAPAYTLLTSVTGTGKKVGMHIDIWPDETVYTGTNVGPGHRYISFVPGVTLDCVPPARQRPKTTEEKAERRAILRDYVSDRVGSDALRCYFILLNGPHACTDNEKALEGYGNMPVDRLLHDGSTVDQPLSSSIALVKTPLLPGATYESLV